MNYKFGLCAGRHEIPQVQDFIFNEVLDPTDFDGMLKTARETIPADADSIEVFVTGLTPAMLAVARVCFERQADLIAWHYDRDAGDYKSQEVLIYGRCLFCGSPMPPTAWECPHCGST